MGVLHMVRYALLAVVLVFSLIVLGLSANFLNLSTTLDGSYLVFEALDVAVATLTLITIIPIMVIDFLRKGAFTSLVVFELGWVFILMILWIAAAAETSATPIFVGSCSEFDDDVQSICHQFQAIQAFSWLIFIILFGWLITLVIGAIVSHNRGNTGVWTSPVSDTAFFGGGGHRATTNNPSTTPGGYPPQNQPMGQPAQMQQQGGYSQGYPSPPGSQPGYPTPPPGSHQGYPTPPPGPQQGYQGTPPPQHHGQQAIAQV